MEIIGTEYQNQFTIEERKAMTAQMLKELRKGKKLSQKEVAAHLNIPATTYNTYESGRTEPPIEILVRLSYLYNMAVDVIVQRERTYRNAGDLNEQLADVKTQLDELDRQIAEKGDSVPPFMKALRDSLAAMVDGVADWSKNPDAQQSLDIPSQK